jgi:hypothetical protein
MSQLKQKDYYGSKAFEGDDQNGKERQEDDYVRNYSITNNLSEELSNLILFSEQVQ